jgi:hypothetical protein
LIFGALFFVSGSGVWVLINNFIPELLSPGSSGEDQAEIDDSLPNPGSRVNITLDDSRPAGVSALPEMFRPSGAEDDVGDISDLVSGVIRPGAAQGEAAGNGPFSPGIDQSAGDGYNKGTGVSASDGRAGNSGSAGVHAAGSGDFGKPRNGGMSGEIPSGPGDLPDLETVAGSFFGQAGTREDNAGPGEGLTDIPPFPNEKPKPARGMSGSKHQPLKGDFNPQELAAGIRTVLNKD